VLGVRGNVFRIPHLSVQDMRKAGAIQLLTGPWESLSFRPVSAICEVAESGSRIAQKLGRFLGQPT
jgi:hypothetical protein